MISLTTLGYLPCATSLMRFQFLLNFKIGRKLFILRLCIFKVIVVDNTITISSLTTWSNKEFIFINMPLTLNNRMVLLNKNIVI